jgi:hypothetical protein
MEIAGAFLASQKMLNRGIETAIEHVPLIGHFA